MNSYLVKYEASAIIIDQVVINAETKDDAINSAMGDIKNIIQIVDIVNLSKIDPVTELAILYTRLDSTKDPVERKNIIDRIENVKNEITTKGGLKS